MSSVVEPKMYMRVKGVRGDVTSPAALMGAIAIQQLSWPGSTVRTGLERGRLPLTAQAFPDFTSMSRAGNQVEVTAGAGGHSSQLSNLSFQQRGAAILQRGATSDVNVEIWIALEHNKFLRGVLTSVLLDSSRIDFYGSLRAEIFRFKAASGRMRAM